MHLIIVESPTKAKTIGKFLGKKYSVVSSFGHIRDLPKSELGIDIENDFKPKYIIPTKSRKTVSALKKAADLADQVILATDEDREGESIAFHLAEILKLKNPERIVFHEITKPAIENALKNSRKIDQSLVDSQQARRILDRIVGYKLSPFLWKKLMRGLSAGRVQSVAVRLVCEREKEIEKFIPQEFWSIEALLNKIQDKTAEKFKAILAAKNGKSLDKLEIKNQQEAEDIKKELENAKYQVSSVEKKEVKRNPLPPFTTSSLQQEAWNKMKYSAKKTMLISQKLYEQGLITYHRTDSFNLSSQSQQEAKNYIENKIGKEYWPGFPRTFKTKSKGAQEAHEAIRPAYIEKTSSELKLESQFSKLYDLIWKRFIASQMSQAVFDSTKLEIQAKSQNSSNSYDFTTNGQILKFEGFLKLYPLKFTEVALPQIENNEILKLKELSPLQHFTQPPARYTEASLIKILEKQGIGRPSTYAPILDTIQKRNYVEKDDAKRFKPTQTGNMVNEILVEHFPAIVDIQFTANMEQDLDEIAEGKTNWVKTLQNFYTPFELNLKNKEKEVVKKDTTESTDKICPKCQSPIIIKLGRFGKFYACSKFPECKHTESLAKPALMDIKCPKCKEGDIVGKNTKKRKLFYGCNKWPNCDFALWDKPTGAVCEKCGSLMVEKYKKEKCSNKECK